MKDYIYNRIVKAEQCIHDELNFCINYKKAKDIQYSEIRKRVMSKMDIKSMPNKYKEQIEAILWFCYKREVLNKYLFPVLFEGKLYSKWNAMPERCKELQRSAPSCDLSNRPYPVFSWHFSEGMNAE